MGKIQDAIRKVQRSHGIAATIQKEANSLQDEHLVPGFEDQSGVPVSKQSGDGLDWEYSGREFEIERQQLIDVGLLDPDYLRKHLTSEYRQIKRVLLNTVEADNSFRVPRSNLIMVSSAEAGEGKSFFCLNFSMSLALEFSYSVVLVDSDLENPRLSRMLGVGQERGLIDLIADQSHDSAELISPTDIPRLSVLPAGEYREGTAEFWTSDRASIVLDGLSTADRRRILVFDSSPVHSSTIASELARQVGQIVLVARAGKTGRRSVSRALKKLNHSPNVSIVLNQVVDFRN